MRTAYYKDLTELWHREAESMILATKDEIDFVSGLDVIRYDNLVGCDSMSYDFDLGRDLWLNRARFTVLQKEYLDLSRLESFLDRSTEIGLGGVKHGVVTSMPFRAPENRARKHRWGGCMSSLCFRMTKEKQPVLILQSRVTYITYMGGADLALCTVIAGEIGRRVGIPVRDFAFRWSCASHQAHSFKGIPYLFRSGLWPLIVDAEARLEYPDSEYPTLKLIRKWANQIVSKHENNISLSSEIYGPLKRVRRRYEEWMNKEYLPSCPVDTLNLQPLRERG
jgi:hypothetical protein